jgi:uncharacterized protein DUF5678
MPVVKTLDASLLADIAPNTWVAISEDQETVVATAPTLDEVLALSRNAGIEHPFVILVPEQNSALIL